MSAMLQVEARLRQLEGRDLGAAAIGGTPGGPAKYDKSRASGSMLASAQPAYATDADMQLGDGEPANGATEAHTTAPTAAAALVDGAKKQKEKKKVRMRQPALDGCCANRQVRAAALSPPTYSATPASCIAVAMHRGSMCRLARRRKCPGIAQIGISHRTHAEKA